MRSATVIPFILAPKSSTCFSWAASSWITKSIVVQRILKDWHQRISVTGTTSLKSAWLTWATKKKARVKIAMAIKEVVTEVMSSGGGMLSRKWCVFTNRFTAAPRSPQQTLRQEGDRPKLKTRLTTTLCLSSMRISWSTANSNFLTTSLTPNEGQPDVLAFGASIQGLDSKNCLG